MRVGFIGLGTMGRHMAGHLQKAGYDLVVNDIREEAGAAFLEAGATWGASPKAVMEACDVVFTSLPAPWDVEAVALGPSGLAEGAATGKVFFDMSTNSPTVIRKIHAELAPLGVQVLDAPVSGGPSGAESGKLSIFVGGDESVFEAHLEMLLAIGDAPVYVGAIGAGAVAKLVHNLAAQSVNLAIQEAMMLGVKAGVDPLTLWRAVRKGASGRRRTFDSTRFYTRSFEPASFRLGLAHKDVSLAMQLAHELNVPMRLSSLTLDEMSEAIERGFAERDSSSLFLLQEERAGVHMEISQADVDRTLAE